PSCTGALLQIHADDTATTSYCQPQAEIVNQFLEFQTQDVMMQPQQGSLLNMILNFSNPQPSFENPFELHASNPKPNPILKSNPVPEPQSNIESEFEPNFETEAECVIVAESPFEDPELPLALDSIKGRPQPVQDLVKELTNLVGHSYAVRVVSPNGMYPEPVDEAVAYSELLQIFLNKWLNVTLLHWFA
ncbi:hypothetical protein M8C21_007304, partial [Ambrosia artemisiifolia]